MSDELRELNSSAGPGPRRWGTWLTGVFFLSFIYFLPWANDWDQDARLDLSMAIVNRATLSIDAFKANTNDVAIFDGHFYAITAPGQSMLGVPVAAGYQALLRHSSPSAANALANSPSHRGLGSFILLQYIATMFTVAFPATFLLLLFFWFLQFFSSSTSNRVTLTLALGFGTMVFPYAKTFYSHVPAAALLFASFVLIYLIANSTNTSLAQRFRTRPRFTLVIAGLLLGASEVFEYTAVIIGILIVAYACVSLPRKSLFLIVLGVLPGALAVMAYSLAIYHNPLVTGYSAHSVIWGHALGRNALSGFSFPPPAAALSGMSFSPYRGLFFLSPFLALAFPGFYLMVRRNKKLALLCISIPSVYFFVIAMCPFWDAGSTIGPRYLIPALPFLALPIIFVLDGARHVLTRMALFAAMAISVLSVAIMTLGSRFGYPNTSYKNPLFSFAIPHVIHGEIAPSFGTLVFLILGKPNSVLTLLPLACLLVMWTSVSFRKRQASAPPVSAQRLGNPELVR